MNTLVGYLGHNLWWTFFEFIIVFHSGYSRISSCLKSSNLFSGLFVSTSIFEPVFPPSNLRACLKILCFGTYRPVVFYNLKGRGVALTKAVEMKFILFELDWWRCWGKRHIWERGYQSGKTFSWGWRLKVIRIGSCWLKYSIDHTKQKKLGIVL